MLTADNGTIGQMFSHALGGGDNKCWELCLVFHLHCDLSDGSVYVCALQDSAGVAIACCFVTAAFASSFRYPPHQDPSAPLGSSTDRSEHGLRR